VGRSGKKKRAVWFEATLLVACAEDEEGQEGEEDEEDEEEEVAEDGENEDAQEKKEPEEVDHFTILSSTAALKLGKETGTRRGKVGPGIEKRLEIRSFVHGRVAVRASPEKGNIINPD
jgi:hypothetical protein